MKRPCLLLAVVLSARVAGAAMPAGEDRRVISLSGAGWTADGESVRVPHTWNAIDGADGLGACTDESANSPSYARRRVVYRRQLPPNPVGRRAFVRFGGASERAAVRVNGKEVGRHEGAYTAFAFEVTEALRDDGGVLEVEVDNFIDPARSVPPWAADYSVFGGLYRDVEWIETAATCIDPLHFAGPGVWVEADASGAVQVDVRIRGSTPGTSVVYEVKDPSGKLVAKTASKSFRVKNPTLWTPETPALYTLTARLTDGASRDSVSVRFGFRSFAFRPDGFYLNGMKRKIRGVNRHQDREGKGWAVSAADETEDIEWIKRMGADGLRTAHYPQSGHIYDLCDEKGLLAWVESPNVNALKDDPAYLLRAETNLTEAIWQLKNHPSIFVWSVCNEVATNRMDGTDVAEKVTTWLDGLAKGLDPSRPSASASFLPYQSRLNAITDVVGFNFYPGWYRNEPDGMKGTIDDALEQNPGLGTIGVTEYGAGASVLQHGDALARNQPQSPLHIEEWQAWVHYRNYRQIRAHERVWGSFVWAMFDFAADVRHEGPRHGINDKGLVTFDHKTPKDAFYFYKANWSMEPELHLVGSRMTETTNENATVVGFSNLGEVRLFLNGSPIGTQMPDEVNTVVWKGVRLAGGRNVVRLESGGRTVEATWNLISVVSASAKRDLWISNHTDFPQRGVVHELVGLTNVVYDAKGVCEKVRGEAIAYLVRECQGLTIRNVHVDQESPSLVEARIVRFEDGETVVRVDRAQFPVAFVNGRMVMTGAGWTNSVCKARLYHANGLQLENAGDVRYHGVARERPEEGTIVLQYDFSREGDGMKPGDRIVFRPGLRPYPAIAIQDSSDVVLEDVVVQGAIGMGLIAQRSKNVTWRGTRTAEARTSGVWPRAGCVASTHADASHFSNVGGFVRVENCWFEGMMDDAINVHSTCLQIADVLDARTIRCRYRHHESIGFDVFSPGERIRFIRSLTNEEGPVATVVSVRRLAADEVEIALDKDVPTGFGCGDAVENADFQCGVEFRGNVVRNNRARGALFTTPKPVVVESNRFERCTSAAIVIEGDSSYWFESGFCKDVLIRGNVFSNCLVSARCHEMETGMISIHPQIDHLAEQKTPCHRNIRIEDNLFLTFDATLLFARSASGIHWRNNRVVYNSDFQGWGEPPFVFDRCTGVDVTGDPSPGIYDESIQRAIDAAALRGGGVVRVSPGEHVIRPLVLKSGVTLHLERDAVLLASTNRSDYVVRDGSPVLVGAFDATNVAIVGDGVIDGRGHAFEERQGLSGESQPVALPVLMRFSRCRNVRLEGFAFRQAAAWGIHLRNNDGVVVRRVKAFSHVNESNDGIDIESRNVLVEDCELDTDDDALVFKSESDPSFAITNVLVRNCTLASCCNFIKFGTGSYGRWKDIRVENCRLRRAGASWRFDWRKRIPGVTEPITGLAAIALEVVDGGQMENVTVRNISWEGGVQTPLFVRLDRRHGPASGCQTFFRNVLIENVCGDAESRLACSVTGVPGLRLSGVTLRNIDLTFMGGGTPEEARAVVPEAIGEYPDSYMFGHSALPAWGIYFRHCADVNIDGVTLRLKPGGIDAREPVVLDDSDIGGLPTLTIRMGMQ